MAVGRKDAAYMNSKNDLEVIINNKRYTISGYESDEYLHKIASHINSKYAQFRTHEGYNHLDAEIRNVLMQINLADDYYKALRQKSELEDKLNKKNEEIFELRSMLVDKQTQIDELTQKLADCDHNYNEAQKRIIHLEAIGGNSET